MAYIHCGFDALKACRFLDPKADDKTITQRAWRLMKREDIQEAISDKTTAIQTKQAITRENMIDRINALVARADNLPEGDPNKNEKFAVLMGFRAVAEINKVLGYHIQHHVHTNTDTVIQFLDVDEHGEPIKEQPLQIAEAPPAIDVTIPSEHAVQYDVNEILDPENEISMETDDDLPEDL